MVCLNHPHRDAAAVCASCGKPPCNECILKADGNIYCSEACHLKGAASAARSTEIISTSAKVDSKARKRFWITFITVLILAGAGYYFYTQNRKAVDKKLDKISKTVRKETRKVIKEGKDSMPRETKYKRDHEALVN